jgi:hypothetical protein
MICIRQLLALLLSFMKAVFVIVVIFKCNFAKALVQAGYGLLLWETCYGFDYAISARVTLHTVIAHDVDG